MAISAPIDCATFWINRLMRSLCLPFIITFMAMNVRTLLLTFMRALSHELLGWIKTFFEPLTNQGEVRPGADQVRVLPRGSREAQGAPVR